MRSVTVVGGGLVGAVSALFLARRGYDVEVLEGRPDPRLLPPPPGRSVALVLSARGWRALAALGLEQDFRGRCIPLAGRVVHHAGGDTSFHRYGAEGQAIYCTSRTVLNAALLDVLDGEPRVDVRFGQRVTGVDLRARTLTVASGESGEPENRPLGDRVLAADGAFSAVRWSLLKTDRFDYDQRYLGHGYKELTMDGSGLAGGAMHIWPRGDRMLAAFPMLDGGYTCTWMLPFEGEMSFAALADARAARAMFARELPDAIERMPHFEQEFDTHPTSSLVSMRCYPWAHDGRVALIGDAAHAMVPFFGQGMNAGFEDCQVLDGCLERAGDDWGKALEDYQRLRKVNCDAVTELSMRHFSELSDHVGDPQFAARKHLEERIHARHPEVFIPLYTRVAFTHMPYHDALVASERQRTMVDELMAVPAVVADPDSDAAAAEIDRCVARSLS